MADYLTKDELENKTGSSSCCIIIFLEYYKQVADSFLMSRCISQVFTVVFIMEMILKLVAFGIKEYCKNKWNLFDGTIVILSVLDMVLTYSGAISGAGLSVLRTFRLVCWS